MKFNFTEVAVALFTKYSKSEAQAQLATLIEHTSTDQDEKQKELLKTLHLVLSVSAAGYQPEWVDGAYLITLPEPSALVVIVREFHDYHVGRAPVEICLFNPEPFQPIVVDADVLERIASANRDYPGRRPAHPQYWGDTGIVRWGDRYTNTRDEASLLVSEGIQLNLRADDPRLSRWQPVETPSDGPQSPYYRYKVQLMLALKLGERAAAASFLKMPRLRMDKIPAADVSTAVTPAVTPKEGAVASPLSRSYASR